jgi:hypothetical protein
MSDGVEGVGNLQSGMRHFGCDKNRIRLVVPWTTQLLLVADGTSLEYTSSRERQAPVL